VQPAWPQYVPEQLRTGAKPAAPAKAKAKVEGGSTVAASATKTSSANTSEPTPGTSKDPDRGEGSIETADDESKTAAANDDSKQIEQPKNDQPQQPKQQQVKRSVAGGQHLTADAKARADRERKSFVTLSYIVIEYVVCWLPFHVVYEVTVVRPEFISQDLFTVTFWLAYLNSTINPFLYAFSSADLRNAVVKMLKSGCVSQ